jgi:hypothetical protein
MTTRQGMGQGQGQGQEQGQEQGQGQGQGQEQGQGRDHENWENLEHYSSGFQIWPHKCLLVRQN